MKGYLKFVELASWPKACMIITTVDITIANLIIAMKIQRAINALKVRKNLGEILEEVYYKGTHFVIKRGEKPMAVLISMPDYEAYLKQHEEDFKVFDEIRKQNKDKRAEEIEKDVEEAIRAVRKGWRKGAKGSA